MKRLLISSLVLLAVNSYGQSKTFGSKDSVLVPQKIESKKDTTIPVEYLHPRKYPSIAYFINGRYVGRALSNIDPDQIKSINIIKIDTTISGTLFHNRLYIEYKDKISKYVPDLITLRNLVDNYTKIKKKPFILTINGKLINADYGQYKVDKKSILKILVEPFANTQNGNEMWLVKILTKTKANIERSKQIMLRGKAGIARIN